MKLTKERLECWWQEFAVHGASEEEEDEIMRLALLGLKYEQMQKDRKALLTWAREKKIPVVSLTEIPD